MSTPWKSSNPLLLSILMRKFAVLGASALVLSLGVANASAQPTADQPLSRLHLSASSRSLIAPRLPAPN
jgi:hypothetical protein